MSLPLLPPADFDDVINRYGRGAVVNWPIMAYFDFRDAPMALWPGEYDLQSGGVTWQGLARAGVLINIEGLQDTGNLDASETTITVSGVDAKVTTVLASEDRAAYVGRLCGLYMQFCDENWQPLCSPYAIWAGFMGDALASRNVNEKGASVRSIALPISNLFYGRGISKGSYNTDRDQKLRFPGDRFMEFIGPSQDIDIPVPWH